MSRLLRRSDVLHLAVHPDTALWKLAMSLTASHLQGNHSIWYACDR